MNGKGYNTEGDIEFEIKDGIGNIKEYYSNDNLLFEGEYLNGKGKEYKLNYKREYLNGKKWKRKRI